MIGIGTSFSFFLTKKFHLSHKNKFRMVRDDGDGGDDDDDERKQKKHTKRKTPKKRTNDESNFDDDSENKKKKKRKIRETRTEEASKKVEELKILNSEKTCRICEKVLTAKMFSAKQLLKAKPACIECSKQRAEMAATAANAGENRKPERLKKMTRREKLEGAIQRRKQQREEKRQNKDKREALVVGEEVQKDFVPAKMVPSKTERDVDESNEVAQRSMYCGGIPFHKTEEDIRAAFDEVGLEVDNLDCMVFADSGRFRGIAIITFHNIADRNEALKFDGEDWEGFSMVCKPYKVKKSFDHL